MAMMDGSTGEPAVVGLCGHWMCGDLNLRGITCHCGRLASELDSATLRLSMVMKVLPVWLLLPNPLG